MENIIQYILKDKRDSKKNYPYVSETLNNKVKYTVGCVNKAKRFSKNEAIIMCIENDNLIIIEEVCSFKVFDLNIELKEI